MKINLFSDRKWAWLWLVVRVYVGWQWLEAGWQKVINPAWFGSGAGTALTGFLNGSLAKTSGAHPDVAAWYAWLIRYIGLPGAHVISHLVALGELLVGAALILGAYTNIAAIGGVFMNMNYLLAGTISSNPTLLLLQVFLIGARRISGYYGLDRFISHSRRS